MNNPVTYALSPDGKSVVQTSTFVQTIPQERLQAMLVNLQNQLVQVNQEIAQVQTQLALFPVSS